MRQGFVKTENYARFIAGVKAVEERGAAEAGMMLVHGQPGLGKSHIVYRWAEEAGAVFLRANVDWTPKYCLIELSKALNLDTRGTAQALFERCLRVLIERQWPTIPPCRTSCAWSAMATSRARRRTCAITAARSTLRASWARRGARARIFCGVRLIRAPTPRPTTAPARR